MNTTSYMDKQIMDLSQGSSPQTKDFMDLMSHHHHHHAYHHRPHHDLDDDDDDAAAADDGVQASLAHGGASSNGLSNKDEILASYDFQPIRPLAGLAGASTSASQPASFDHGGSARVWNSVDSNPKTASPIRNYGSLDSVEPAKFILEKDHKSAFDSAIIAEIDKTMKKHVDNLMHALDGVSARLTQLETRTRQLESSVDDVKVSAGNNHGMTDGKMRQLENILREVQSGVQVIKDKQDIVEAQLQLAKLQVSSKVDHHQETQTQNVAVPVDSVLTSAASAPQQPPHQQLPPPLPPINLPPPPHAPFSPPNAPPQPPPQHSLPPPVQLPSQFPQTQIPPGPRRDPYFPSTNPTQEPPNQQYQMPPTQQQLPPPTMPPQHQQFQPNPQPQFSQPPPPPQQHPSLTPVNPSQLQPQLSHHSEDPSYVPPQIYPPPNHRQAPNQPPSGPPPSQPFYGGPPPPPPPHLYDQAPPPPSSRPSSGFPSGYSPPSGLNDPYHYVGSPTQYGNLSGMKSQQLSSPTGSQSSGGGYPQLPTARVLPHPLPSASAAGGGGGSGSSGSGNRVPVDDVIDKVTTMGFPRDHVRATVRKLTENGQSVDLNIVLDKLMNEGDGQPPRGWFGR